MKQNNKLIEYVEKSQLSKGSICNISNTEKGNLSRILNGKTEIRPSTLNRTFDDMEKGIKKELELINKLRN